MRLSYSSISTYLNCPLAYKYRYVERMPTKRTSALAFGSSLHAALAKFYKVPVPKPPSLEELLSFLEKNWEKEPYTDEAEEKAYFKHAQEVLTNFYHTNIEDFRIPLSLEEKIQIKLDSCDLSVIIDRLDKLGDGTYEIIDYKTSRRLPPRHRVDTDLQLSIYHLATEKHWGITPDRLSLYFLLPNQKMTTSRTKEQIQETKEIIKQVVANIEEKKFEPKENPLCPWCDFQKLCPYGKHKYLTKEEEPEAVAIETVVDEYVELKGKVRSIYERLNELQAFIHQYCEEQGLARLYASKGSVLRSPRSTSTYDKAKLKEILEPLGLWEQILEVDSKKVRDLLKSEGLEEEVKQAIETAKEVNNISYTLYVRDVIKAAE